MTQQGSRAAEPSRRPGLTACSLCAGETLEGLDMLPGGQRTRLERLAADGVARLTLSECLDECNRGDVLVARPSPAARRAGRAKPVWLEQVAGDDLTQTLRTWLTAGGPGIVETPTALVSHIIAKDEEAPEVVDEQRAPTPVAACH